MKNYAIDYALKQPTIGVEFNGKVEEPFTLLYDKHADDPDKAKKQFIQSLNPGDKVYLETGAGAERFCLGCYRQGAQVLRIPGYKVHKELKSRGWNPNQTAEVISEFAQASPNLFYKFQEKDSRVAEVALLARAYYRIQKKMRIPLNQQMEACFSDLDIVEKIGVVDIEMAIQNDLADKLLGSGRVYLEKEKRLETTQEAMNRILKGIEDNFYATIKKKLNQVPVFKGVFEHIKGCGPAISARLIGGIANIDYFPAEPNLISYAGYSFFPDGSRVQRLAKNLPPYWSLFKRIEELYPEMTPEEIEETLRMNWSPRLKQATWDFTEQIRGYANEEFSRWKKAYNWRYAYEEANQEKFQPKPDGTTSYPKDRAMRWLGKVFLIHVFRAWNRFEKGGDYQVHNFECLRS